MCGLVFFLLQQRMSSHCQRRPTLYDLGCVSACSVVGFRLPLDLCLCCLLFLGEVFWRGSFMVVVVVRIVVMVVVLFVWFG